MQLIPIADGITSAFEPARKVLKPILSNPTYLAGWGVLILVCVGTLWWDIRKRNRALPSMMKFVWTLVVAYSGPFGLAVYWYSGRTQISNDSLWRRGFRSTSHCYSGCGAGEVVGMVAIAGALAIGSTLVQTVGTFALAYTFGYALTMGPLMQEGESFRTAFSDTFYSETPSITIMEITAIGTDLLLAQGAKFGDPLFWGSLAFSLSVGFLFAYPVNTALVRFGVKEGMMNPKKMRDDGAQAAD